MTVPNRAMVRNGVRVAATGPTLTISGILREPEVGSWLIPLVEEMHQSAVEEALEELVLDLRNLEYGNASIWKCLVHWLKLAREDPRARYRLRVRSSAGRRWQEIGMSALRVFGGDRLVVAHDAAD